MEPKIFITSDTFFGRKNIIQIANRPFENVEEMNAALVENWNSVVGEDDIVYHLGNFAWTPTVADEMLKVLNGNIKFILGEYDDSLIEVFEYYEGVDIIPNDIFKDYDNKIVLSHWPLESWPGKDNGIYHFHGNTLRELKTDLTRMKRVNVCCDNWNFIPQEVKVLFDIFKDFEEKTPA
jgi:calcineurin-like phosphoesterase family protein